MFLATVFRRKSKFSSIVFIYLTLVAASFSFGAFGDAGDVGDDEKRREEKLASFAAGLKSVINGTYFSPASTFIVNNNGDSVDQTPGDGVCADAAGSCTLRAAIQQANASAGTDSITFALTSVPATIQLDSTLSPAELIVSEAVAINGPGARLLTVSGNSGTTNGIFKVSAVTAQASISGMTVVKSGGHGVNNEGRLSLSDVSIKTNRTGINNSGRLNINRVAVSGNIGGGGVYLAAGSIVNISNATITNNYSATSGGGIYSLSADVTLNNVTVSYNSAGTSGGGIYYNNAAAGVNVRNTIIAGNTAPTGPDIFAVNAAANAGFVSRGNNLIGKSAVNMGFTNAANGDKVGTLTAAIDPLLGALQNNGGATDTRSLLTGSPAIDAGNMCVISAGCANSNPVSPLSADQRGTDFPRIYDGNNDNAAAVDIGAFEAFYPVASISSFVPTNWGAGRGAFELVINGTNFVADSKVKWNGQDRTATFVSNTQIRAQILASDTASAGQFPVTVVNPSPGGGASEAVNFSVVDCSYSINPANQTFTAAGGTGGFNVAAMNGCAWTAATNGAPWLTLTGESAGSGNGTVAYSVAPNNGPARTATITAGGQTFTITQANGCTYALSSSGTSFDAAGGSGSFQVAANNTGCTWTAATTSPWITINGGSPGTGSGTVSFTVHPNVSPERTGKIIVGGTEFTITQSNGCSYSLSAANSPPIPASGGTGSFTVNTGAGCNWTANVNAASWITITSGASGTGSGSVNYTAAANNGAPRSGTITAGGKTYTVNQDNGCTFTLSPTGSNVAAAGGSVTVTVTASDNGCAWTSAVTAANASWIAINSGATGVGNGTVQLTIAASNGPARTGTVTIAGRTLTVNQASGCVYSLSPTSLNINESGGNRSFNIVAGSGCAWTVASNDAWLTITSGTSGAGSGTINFTVAANTGAERTGTITAGGQTFTVNQLNLIVSNLNDDGAGSLRRAVANASAAPGDDVITFQPSAAGTIVLTSGEIMINDGNGALEIKGLGADVLKISGNNSSRIFYTNNSRVTITDLTLTGGNGAGTGSTETAKYGGAIFVNGGSLALVRVNVFRNIITVPPSSPNRSIGGGVYFQDGTNYLIRNSTISQNSAAVGGGLFNQGELTIINSTIAGNTGSGEGGGIYTVGLINLLNSTITGNSCVGADKGAGIIMWGGVLNIGNTIVAGNTGPEISFIRGSVASAGNNLIGDAAGDSTNTSSRIIYLPTDILDTQPMLGALEMYGGRTFTAALLPGSPAIDAGNRANAPTTDQRGSPRIIGEAMDIGAFEHNITVTPSSTSLADGTINASYSQLISAQRFGATDSTARFRYSIVDGYLPNGVEISYGSGIIQGTPTSGGIYTFTVRAMGEDGMAGVNKYTVSVGCSYAISPADLRVGVGGASGIVSLTTSPGCAWTAVSNVPWITVGNSAASGTGSNEIPFTVAANMGAVRTGTMIIGGKTFTVTQSTGCAYILSAPSASVSRSGGTTAFNINTGTGCSWAAVSNASWITITGAANGSGTATITINTAANSTVTARSGTVTIGGQTFTVNQAPSTFAPNGSVLYDYDGDRKSDVSVYRPSTGVWHLFRSQAGYGGAAFGIASDKLAPADYDGDGRTDLAVFREGVAGSASPAYFYILNSSDGTVRAEQFGSTGDVPVAGDWDGDGKAEVAVYRSGTPANPQGYFYYRSSAPSGVQFASIAWGSSSDKPVPADYDGDGKADAAVFRPSNGVWYMLGSRDGFVATAFGVAEDKPVVGDYDGDGKADAAVFRPSNGVWYMLGSRDGFAAAAFGVTTDKPVPADYDGDGRTDIAVYRDGSWFMLNSASGFAALGFGLSSDKPVQNVSIP